MKETSNTFKTKLENIYILLFLAFMICLYFLLDNGNILFLTNIVALIWIVTKSKFSFFSIKTILVNYILFSVFSQYNYGSSYGVLALEKIELNYIKINSYILIYNIIILFILVNTKMLKNEKKLLNRKIEMSNLSAWICSIIGVASALIAMPTLPFLDSYQRFDALFLGDAWNHIAIIALLFAIPKLKESRVVQGSYVFVIFWFLSHYERVDVIGFIIAIALIICIKKIQKFSWQKILKLRNNICEYFCNNDIYWRIKNGKWWRYHIRID